MAGRDLRQALSQLPPIFDKNLLAGQSTLDDAGVYRLSDDLALVQTVDFFSPVVDDPYDCGQIVAANCLSDCYAMGGRPLCAMNLVAWPRAAVPIEVVTTLLRGGQDAFQAAGVTVVGGHSMYSQELFYGAAITGLIHPSRIVTNANAQPGDHLVLTKPLGTGLVAYGIHGQIAPAGIVARATAVMKQLNREASEAMVELGAHAATDVTGYGLCGHALTMAEASAVSLHIEARRLPLLEGLEPLVAGLGETMGQVDNHELCADKVSVVDSVTGLLRAICFDPQTSGGLLVSLPPENAAALVRRLRGRGIEASIIGRVTAKERYCVLVE